MSVRKRGKKWTARLYVGKSADYPSGWRWLGSFDRKREAEDAKAEARRNRGPRAKETCDSFAERWARDYPRERASTNRTNAENIRPFARDFAGVPLSVVDRPRAMAWARENRTYARYARALFEDARNDGLVADNPFSNLRLTQPRGRRDLHPLTSEQVDELADLAYKVSPPDYAATARAIVLFLAHVGVRPGELQALTWDNLDLSRGEARIAFSVDEKGVVTETKTYRARTVLIPPKVRAAIAGMPRRADAQHVFLSRTGKQLNYGMLRYAWEPIRAAAQAKELPVDDMYELRHAAATILLDRGASSDDVADQLGCSRREIERTYGHPSEELARERLRRIYGENVAELRPVRDAEETHG